MREEGKGTPSVEELFEYLDEHIEKASNLYNSNITTDTGQPIQDYYKGYLNAFVEVKGYMRRGKEGGKPK